MRPENWFVQHSRARALALALLFLAANPAIGDDVSKEAGANRAKAEAADLFAYIESLNSRITELESKLAEVMAALGRLEQKNNLNDRRMNEVAAQIAETRGRTERAQAGVEELKMETKRAVSSGNAKISFYGSIVANSSAADSQLFISDIPLWAVADGANLSPAPINGQSVPGLTLRAGDIEETTFTMRQTRLGFRAGLPKVGAWTPSAQVEIDFFGARPVVGQGATFNQPRIRLGYLALEHESGWKLVAGQDWIIFAPENPTSFAHFAIPQASAAGNIWLRFPQIRVEKSFALGESKALAFQAGVLRALGGGDAPAAGSLADLPALAGERSGQPFYQARLSFLTPWLAGKNLTLGASGHYGREDTGPNTIDTWGAAVDYKLPLHDKIGLSGEIWIGSNLDSFQAGIFQGAALFGNRFRKIDAAGGWMQLGIAPTKRWSLNLGYGQDDPEDRDLIGSVNRAKNQLWWANLLFKIHPGVTVALEYNYFDTLFKAPRQSRARVGTANYVNLAFVYSF